MIDLKNIDFTKYYVKPDLTEIKAEFTAELTLRFQEVYGNGCEDGRSFEKQRILSLLHDSINDTPTTPDSMKDHWNQTIRAMMKKIKAKI
jgi:(p)ppGpp synthase/HD superfamily hydrolase